MHIPRWIRLLLLIAVIVYFTWKTVVGVLVDWLWFDSLGYTQVFTTSLVARVLSWTGGFLLALLFIGGNLHLANRRAPVNSMRLSLLLAEMNLLPTRLQALIRWLLIGGTVVPALLFGGVIGARWFDLLELTQWVPFGVEDPVFGHDVGFYVFVLPVLGSAQGVGVGLLAVTLVVCLAWYGLQALTRSREAPELSPFARTHLLGLGALLFFFLSAGWVLDRYDLLFQQHGVVWGVGHADQSARLPGFLIMAAVAVAAGLGLVASIFRSGWRMVLGVLGVYVLSRVLVAGVWPRVVQDYIVRPNELDLERPFLQQNIAATQEAYALDRIEVRPFEAATDLTMAELEANPLTVENIRVWDTGPLLTTYSQIQEIRTYYDFVDVDVDRYVIDGTLRQVMLSARELNQGSLPQNARTWVNQHLTYTHGYGLTMSPVNVVTREGLPDLFIQDIPPQSEIGFEIARPELYFGELTHDYVFVDTEAQEFDYPVGDENKYSTYAGEGGIPTGSIGQRLLFALYFGQLNILLSDYLAEDSQVMLRRTVAERLLTLAPFLRLDRDPYVVIHEGRLVWMVDAYTTTSRYPYSEPTLVENGRLSPARQSGLGVDRVNYVRNSVKAVVDAYDGSVELYIADADDPLIQTWARVFPDLFRPMDQMPPGLLDHIRYPSDFFDIQADMYRTYHMTDPTVFYNKEDLWQISRELYEVPDSMADGRGSGERPMPSYYLIMNLPGEDAAEFILLVPFSPAQRDNMIAWMAARCDPEHYGRLILYQFPKQKLIYGPRQVEARINQDPVISQQLTLWNQEGSRTMRGNLLVVPIGNSLLYVEPLYLRAASSELPELKRVIVSYENRIAMEPTLDAALVALFGGEARTPAPEATPERPAGQPGAETPTAPAAGVAGLAASANAAYQRALERQRAGDWVGYGAALKELEALLVELQQAAGPPVPPPAPAPDPAEAPEGG